MMPRDDIPLGNDPVIQGALPDAMNSDANTSNDLKNSSGHDATKALQPSNASPEAAADHGANKALQPTNAPPAAPLKATEVTATLSEAALSDHDATKALQPSKASPDDALSKAEGRDAPLDASTDMDKEMTDANAAGSSLVSHGPMNTGFESTPERTRPEDTADSPERTATQTTANEGDGEEEEGAGSTTRRKSRRKDDNKDFTSSQDPNTSGSGRRRSRYFHQRIRAFSKVSMLNFSCRADDVEYMLKATPVTSLVLVAVSVIAAK